MIDIKDLRENSEKYRKNMRKKERDVKVIDRVLKLDKSWRDVKLRADNLRHERNKISETINKAKKSGDEKKAKKLIKQAKEIPEKLKNLELQEKDLKESLDKELYEIPNLMHPKVPKGKSDADNKVIKKRGRPKKTKPKFNHVELIEELDLGDFEASAKVSGSGFYYLKGDLALLNRALINFTTNFMLKKGYEYVEPPLMIDKEVASAAGDLKAFEDAIYKIEGEDLYLIPTAEHGILGMLSDQTIKESELPLKYFGYSMSFRKEIGSHGINEKGLWRTHQFNKVEQFIFCKPKDSWKYFEELQKNGEEIMKALKLPYRVIEMCSGDLSDWKARQLDIEVWRPTTQSYEEVGSLSNCTDYQARDLDIKGIDKEHNRYVLHTLNNTALATSRIMVAILENFQNKDGSVTLPKVLQKHMGKKKIAGKKAKGKKNKIKKTNKREKVTFKN